MVSTGQPPGGVLCPGIHEAALAVPASLRSPLETLEKALLPSSFRGWQKSASCCVIEVPLCLLAAGQDSLGSWGLPSAPRHVAPSIGSPR